MGIKNVGIIKIEKRKRKKVKKEWRSIGRRVVVEGIKFGGRDDEVVIGVNNTMIPSR